MLMAWSVTPLVLADTSLLLRPIALAQNEATQPQVEATAADPVASPLRVEFTTWIWLMGAEGNVGTNGQSSSVSADFGDVLEASDSLLGFAGRLEIGYGKFAGFVDGFYANIGADDQSGRFGLASVDVTAEQGIVDFGLMYRLGDWEPTGDAAANRRNFTLDLYAGARYSSVHLELDPRVLPSRSSGEDWFDPIVGAKVVAPLSEHWRLELNGDVGGFGLESDVTWSSTAAVGYEFTMFGMPSSLLAGYRAIGWDYREDGGSRFEYDIINHGPIIGLQIAF